MSKVTRSMSKVSRSTTKVTRSMRKVSQPLTKVGQTLKNLNLLVGKPVRCSILAAFSVKKLPKPFQQPFHMVGQGQPNCAPPVNVADWMLRMAARKDTTAPTRSRKRGL